MLLQKLQQKRRLHILGVNSGTSVDGLDLSLVSVSEKKGAAVKVRELSQRSISYPVALRKRLLELGQTQMVDIEQLALTDEALGEFIGKRCRRFIQDQMRKGIRIDCIASHGQTIRHLPQSREILGESVNATVQIGSAERIAAHCERTVISNFRQADTALGGEGAPITTPAVYAALAHKTQSRAVVNIGGIANLFYIPAGKNLSQAQAFDIGPGNMLLDLATKKLFSKDFDKSGALAASGTVSVRLLTLLESKRFFAESNNSTQSTGRERYGDLALERVLATAKQLKLRPRDILATLSQLSAQKITLAFDKLSQSDSRLSEAHITGGGLKNKNLIKRISSEAGELRIKKLQELGFHPDFFEALCYAILGYYCVKGIALPLSTPQRNTRRPILGRISQAPRKVNSKL
jgi:anhydro-N-acetylmuramic acid kinase